MVDIITLVFGTLIGLLLFMLGMVVYMLFEIITRPE